MNFQGTDFIRITDTVSRHGLPLRHVSNHAGAKTGHLFHEYLTHRSVGHPYHIHAFPECLQPDARERPDAFHLSSGSVLDTVYGVSDGFVDIFLAVEEHHLVRLVEHRMSVLTESLEENGVLTLPSVEQIAQFSVLQLSGSDAADLLSVELVTVDERCLVAPCELLEASGDSSTISPAL